MTFFQSRSRSARSLILALLVPAVLQNAGATSQDRAPASKSKAAKASHRTAVRPVKADYPWGIGVFILEDPAAERASKGSQAPLEPRVVIIDATRRKSLGEFPFQFDELDKLDAKKGPDETESVMGEDSAEGVAAIVGGPRMALRTDTDTPRRADEEKRLTADEMAALRAKQREEATREVREAREAAELARAERAEREKKARLESEGALPVEVTAGPEEVAAAGADVMRPVSTFDAIKIRRQLEGVMRKVMKPRLGGSIRVLADEILEGPAEDGRKMYYLGAATAQFQKCTVKDVPVRSGMLMMRNLAVDANALERMELVVLSSPSIAPSLTVDKEVLVNLLQKERVKDAEVRFENDNIVLRGRFPYGIFSIPFQLDGHLMMVKNNLAFKIDSLRVRGSPADPDQVAKLQRKCDRLLPLDTALSAIHASSLSIAGGEIAVLGDGGESLYQARFGGT